MSTPIVAQNPLLGGPAYQIPSPSMSVIAKHSLSMDAGDVSMNTSGVFPTPDDTVTSVNATPMPGEPTDTTIDNHQSHPPVVPNANRILQIGGRPLGMPVNQPGMIPPGIRLNFDGNGRPIMIPGLQIRNPNAPGAIQGPIIHIRPASSGFITSTHPPRNILLMQQQQVGFVTLRFFYYLLFS